MSLDPLDTFRDVTSSGVYSSGRSNLAGSGCAMLIGLAMVPASCILLFFNEARAIHVDRGLSEGASSVVHVCNPAHVDAGNEGKFVHLTGRADCDEILTDPLFSVSDKPAGQRRTWELPCLELSEPM
jgi:hypothetical protein